MNLELTLEMLRLVAKNEPERPAHDLMTLAEALVAYVETRQFPEITAYCTAYHKHS